MTPSTDRLDDEVAGSEAVLVQDPGNEVVEGDPLLLLGGVSRDLDDLHAVEEGRGDGARAVSGGQEDDARQVEGEAHVAAAMEGGGRSQATNQ